MMCHPSVQSIPESDLHMPEVVPEGRRKVGIPLIELDRLPLISTAMIDIMSQPGHTQVLFQLTPRQGHRPSPTI